MEGETAGESRESTTSETAGESGVKAGTKVAAETSTAPETKESKASPQGAATEAGSKSEKTDDKATGGATITRGRRRSTAAVGVDDYQSKVREALQPPTKPVTEEKSPATAGKETTTTAESTETTEAESTTAAETAGKEAATVEDDDKGPDRVRLGRLKDPKDKKRVALATQLAADEEIPFDEAWERVTGKKREAGATKETAETTTEETVSTIEGRSIDEIKTAIDAKKAERKEAAKQLDTTKMVELDDELDVLRDELDTRRRAEERAESERQSREQSAFQAQVSESQAKTVAIYPAAADDNSALAKKMIEIADRMEEQENPLVFQADAPFKIAQMAANELGIAPRDPKAAKAAKDESSTSTAASEKTATTAAKPPTKNQTAVLSKTAGAAASGAARTTQGSNGQGAADLKNIKTVADYEEVLAQTAGVQR